MRMPEDHLTPAEVFGGSNGARSPHPIENPTNIREHIDNCAECAGILELHEALTMLPVSMNGGEACIPEDDIYRLAAGLLPADAAAKMTRHVSGCSACSQMLKQAIEDLDTENIPPLAVDQLKSATAQWQESLATRMASERSVATFRVKSSDADRKSRQRPTLWLFGPIAAMLIAGAVVVYFDWSNHRVERLLAASYNAQRLTELRISGGEPVALFSPKLGSSAQSLLPTQLLEAKLEAQKHLEKSPDDAYWHQVLGRIALVEHDGESARLDFELASALNENLPELKLDRAAAHYEIGETSNNPVQYARAADLYLQYIDGLKGSNAGDLLSIAHYNRALSWEKQSIYCEALRDYQASLLTEKDAAWRRDIQTRIDKLPCSETNHGHAAAPSPSTFLMAERQHPGDVDSDYEMYLDAATKSWITQRGLSPVADLALRDLAKVGLAHRDFWLLDLLAFPVNEKGHDADRHLAAALDANGRGDANIAIVEAARSASLYHLAGNEPGYLRAQAETMYTLQRLGRSHDCLQIAGPLQSNTKLQKYAWLYGYYLLEEASCQGSEGDVLQSVLPVKKSLAVADGAQLRLEQLRAQSFLADLLSVLGETREAWLLASAGLSKSAGERGTEMRTYQFLSTIYFAAKAEGMPWAAAGVADAAAHASTVLENRQIQAYAQEEFGTAETAVHHDPSATLAFQSATEKLQSLGNGVAKTLYTADWTADQAALLAQEGSLPVALERMEGVRKVIDASDNHQLRQRYYAELGHLLLTAGRPQEAIMETLHATADAERALPAMHTGVEKLTWERDNSRGYKILVQSLIDEGNSELSLRAWEWYRSAPYRNAWNPGSHTSAEMNLPAMPELPVVPKNELVLVFARLEGGYAAWSVAGSSPRVRFAPLSVGPERVSSLIQAHASLVKDPASSVAGIAILGTSIFRELMTPFADQIEHAKVLRIDIDASIQANPIAAICDPNHVYLGSSHDILILPPWWSLHDLASESARPLESAVVAAGNPEMESGDSTAKVPNQYEESREVAAKFVHAQLLRYPNVKASDLLAMLPGANVFHYSGHAVERDGVTGLLLTSQDNLLTATSFANRSLHNCWVAVLAGCTTKGRSPYEAEDPRSLVNALLVAGAGNVIATQWDVDARASRVLILHFYDALLSGASPAEALRSAQNSLRASPSTSHPYYWAAYQAYSQ
jgi:CHAT domain